MPTSRQEPPLLQQEDPASSDDEAESLSSTTCRIDYEDWRNLAQELSDEGLDMHGPHMLQLTNRDTDTEEPPADMRTIDLQTVQGDEGGAWLEDSAELFGRDWTILPDEEELAMRQRQQHLDRSQLLVQDLDDDETVSEAAPEDLRTVDLESRRDTEERVPQAVTESIQDTESGTLHEEQESPTSTEVSARNDTMDVDSASEVVPEALCTVDVESSQDTEYRIPQTASTEVSNQDRGASTQDLSREVWAMPRLEVLELEDGSECEVEPHDLRTIDLQTIKDLMTPARGPSPSTRSEIYDEDWKELAWELSGGGRVRRDTLVLQVQDSFEPDVEPPSDLETIDLKSDADTFVAGQSCSSTTEEESSADGCWGSEAA